ncbi:DUF106 domain-containing protein [archaeon]|nr:DUF106 domain-containing protein [archaeon]MBL7056726.1 DUF106 domain-containing protein [Candidatus Woesearchaeota archaeon]
MFEGILNPIFGPLLQFGFFWALVIMCFILTLLITLVYKFTTNQTLMKKLKADMKNMQKELKKMTKENPKKAMAYQKKMMDKNMQYMKHSMKPTLYTFIPIIIIFGWLNANLAFLPIEPYTNFTVSAQFKPGTFGNVTLEVIPGLDIYSDATQEILSEKITWTLNGDAGEYQMAINYNNRAFEKELLISGDGYAKVEEKIRGSELTRITIHNKPVKPLGSVSILGWMPGWLGTYIILSLLFSLGLRKILKIS